MAGFRIVVGLALIAALAACGHDFDRAQVSTAVVGATHDDQIKRQFGPPFRETTTIREGITLKMMTYSFATATGGAFAGGIVPGRSAYYYLRDGVLVGKEFTSNFDTDRTDFDAGKIAAIKEGATTVGDVVAAFGPTEGEWIYPMIPRPNEKALVYLYSEVHAGPFGSGARYRKQLVVSYNADGLVTKVDYTSNKPSE